MTLKSSVLIGFSFRGEDSGSWSGHDGEGLQASLDLVDAGPSDGQDGRAVAVDGEQGGKAVDAKAGCQLEVGFRGWAQCEPPAGGGLRVHHDRAVGDQPFVPGPEADPRQLADLGIRALDVAE